MWNHHLYQVPECFHHPRRKICVHLAVLSIPPSHQSLVITSLLLVYVTLLWIFYTIAVVQYVIFFIFVWLLSVSIFSRLILSTSFLLPLKVYTIFCSLIYWGTFGWSPPVGLWIGLLWTLVYTSIWVPIWNYWVIWYV